MGHCEDFQMHHPVCILLVNTKIDHFLLLDYVNFRLDTPCTQHYCLHAIAGLALAIPDSAVSDLWFSGSYYAMGSI